MKTIESQIVTINGEEFVPASFARELEAKAKAASDDYVSALYLLADIRSAIGDPNGKLMQDELVEKIRQIREELERMLDLTSNEEDFASIQEALRI